MESSFLEDLLKREVDQSQVNALVGTFENQLTTPRSNPLPTKTNAISTAQQLTSLTRLVSQQATASVVSAAQNAAARSAAAPVSIHQLNGKLFSISQASSIPVSITSLSPQNVLPKSPRPPTPNNNRKQTQSPRLVTDRPVSNSPRPMTPTRNAIGLSSAPSMTPISQVNIAPKITNTVPIAPRPTRPGNATTNIMITPRQAQLLMAQRFGPGAALLPNNLLARVPGGGIPVMPNHMSVGAARIPVPPVMNTQIPGIRSPGPRAPPHRLPINPPLGTSLTQIRATTNTTSIPGQVNYRFRQVAPTNTVTTMRTNGPAPPTASVISNSANITMMKESVKRLKEFFQNLINLACGPSQPPEIGKMVKELVHNLMQNRVSEEEFIEKLQKTLKSDPQPNLVHFLKKTLPHLRETIKKQQMQQVNIKVPQGTRQPRPSLIQSSRPRGPRPGVLTGTPRHMTPRHITPQQILANRNLSLQEQAALAKQFHPSRVLVANVTGQSPATGLNKSIQNALHGARMPGLLQSAAAAKDKPKNTYYSSAVGGDDDINDVTCMAGVNLMEESQKILATGADFMHYQTRSINDAPILLMDRLKEKVERIVQKQKLTDISPEVLTIISHAAEERMRSLLERLTACCLHRGDPHKDEVRYETISDVRNQLRVFEEIDEVERKYRDSREREMLMRVAKSRSRTEDPEQARLKEKAKQMQLEEEEVNRKRAANKTALEAIGGPRKKRKLDEALESLQNAQTPSGGGGNSATPSNATNNNSQTTRSRQHRITLKDMLFVLESDRDTSKSLILYRSSVNR